MSETNSDPHDEALHTVAQLAAIVLSATETGVRLRSLRRPPVPRGGGAADTPAPVAHVPITEVSGASSPRSRSATAPPQHSPGPARSSATPTPAPAPAPTGDRPARVASRAAASGRADLLALHNEALDYFHAAREGSWVADYLAQRGLTAAASGPWEAGYAPAGWTQLTDHLRAHGWSDEVLLRSGLSRRARTGNLIDHFRDRLVVPLRDERGRVVAFVGRCAPGADARTPKYLNSPRTTIYDKSSLLFGLHEGRDALRAGATPVLTEGALDAIAVSCAGDGKYVGLAACGTALTDEHVAALGRLADLAERPVVVATDHDVAGDTAAIRAFERLARRATDLHRLQLPSGGDPASLAEGLGPPALKAALASSTQPLLDAVIDIRLRQRADQLQWLEGRVRAARDLAPLLARLPTPRQTTATHELARRLDLLPDTVEGLVREAGSAAAVHTATGSRRSPTMIAGHDSAFRPRRQPGESAAVKGL